jgi:hypothetical protein
LRRCGIAGGLDTDPDHRESRMLKGSTLKPALIELSQVKGDIMGKLAIRLLAYGLGFGGLIAGMSLLTPAIPAQANSAYTICNGLGLCLNSPGLNNDVRAVSSKYAGYFAIDGTTWAGKRVALQQVGNGPNCLEAIIQTLTVAVKPCNDGTGPEGLAQQWWWNSAHQLVNVYVTEQEGGSPTNPAYMYANSNGDVGIVEVCSAPSCIGPGSSTWEWDSNNGVEGP